MRVVRIPVTGPITLDDVQLTLDYMQAQVGGYIEHLGLRGLGAGMYLNEEGKLHGLPPNPRATALARQDLFPGDYIAGDVLVVGPGDDEGEDTDVPDGVLAALTIIDPDEVVARPIVDGQHRADATRKASS